MISGVDFSSPSTFPGFTPNDPCIDEVTLEVIPCPDPVTGEPMVGPGGEPLGRNPDLAVLPNQSLSRLPDGDPQGCWVIAARGTPKEANVADASCNVVQTFRRGDADSDGMIGLADGVFTLNFLFRGGPAPRGPEAAESTDDQLVGLADGVYTFNYLFLGRAAPPAPGPTTCGADPTADDLEECVDASCE